MSALRVGILGCGGVATKHATAIAAIPEHMHLVACASRNTASADAFAARFGATSYIDFTDMLSRASLDLIIIAIPPFAHDGEVEVAAAAGVNLLIEKPIALTETRARSMVDAVTRHAVTAACGFMYRFGDAVLRWDAAAAQGVTGSIGMFIGQFHSNALHAPWWRERARSGGQMVEQLIHIVDLARHQLGMPESVYARSANLFHRTVEHYDSDDASAIVLGYGDGRIGALNATNGALPGRWDKVWQIIGERMTGRFTGWNSAVLTHTGENVRSEVIEGSTDVFIAQLLDINGAIRDRREPRVPLVQGEQTLRIVLAAQKSAERGCEIRV